MLLITFRGLHNSAVGDTVLSLAPMAHPQLRPLENPKMNLISPISFGGVFNVVVAKIQT